MKRSQSTRLRLIVRLIHRLEALTVSRRSQRTVAPTEIPSHLQVFGTSDGSHMNSSVPPQETHLFDKED